MNKIKHIYNQIEVMILRFYKLHYARSKIKIIWSIILPLLIAFAITIIFKNVFNIKNDSVSLVIISGYLFWQCFLSSFTKGLTLFTNERSFFKNLSSNRFYFLPAFSLFNVFISLPGILILGIYCFFSINFTIFNCLLFFGTITMLYFFITGLLFIFATWNVFYPDLSHAIDTLLIFVLWLSPVFYETKDLPENLKWLTFINPIAWGINCFRSSLSISEPSHISLYFFSFSFLAIFIFLYGFGYYLKHQKEIVKYI